MMQPFLVHLMALLFDGYQFVAEINETNKQALQINIWLLSIIVHCYLGTQLWYYN